HAPAGPGPGPPAPPRGTRGPGRGSRPALRAGRPPHRGPARRGRCPGATAAGPAGAGRSWLVSSCAGGPGSSLNAIRTAGLRPHTLPAISAPGGVSAGVVNLLAGAVV